MVEAAVTAQTRVDQAGVTVRRVLWSLARDEKKVVYFCTAFVSNYYECLLLQMLFNHELKRLYLFCVPHTQVRQKKKTVFLYNIKKIAHRCSGNNNLLSPAVVSVKKGGRDKG